MTVRIKTIDIKAFRGVPDLKIDLDGKSLALRGENGSGKSSIVDAIEYFFTGKVSHLEGVRGLSLQRHAPHVNFDKNDMQVSLTLNPGVVLLKRALESDPSPPSDLINYFNSAMRGNFILRRSQMLEFIISRPAERFRAIGNIIGIGTLDQMELELKKVKDKFYAERGVGKLQLNSLFEGLSNLLNQKVENVSEVFSPLNRVLKGFAVSEVKTLEDIDGLSRETMKLARPKQIGRFSMIQKILDLLSEVRIKPEITDQVKRLSSKLKKFVEKGIIKQMTVRNLLSTGEDIIRQEELDECPLCEQPIKRDALLERISKRISILLELTDEASNIRSEKATVNAYFREVMFKCQSLTSNLSIFNNVKSEHEKLVSTVSEIGSFIADLEESINLPERLSLNKLQRFTDSLDDVLDSIQEKMRVEYQQLGLTDNELKAMKVIAFLHQVKDKLNEISINERGVSLYSKRYEVAERIYSSFSESKKNKTQEVYNAIKKDVEDYYSLLHPLEFHKNIVLSIDPERRASAEIKVESYGKVEDPRAFASEGHLDSLGLCIFLSFAKKFNKDLPLIVLDDIVTTIDANHRQRIGNLILEKFAENQLIITTHDEIWYEQLMSSQREHGCEGSFKNLIIRKWDLEEGPSMKPYNPKWIDIQDLLSDGEKNLAGIEGRRYLEWVLEHICETTKAKVLFNKSGRYTIGDLYDPAKKRVTELLVDGGFKDGLVRAFQKIEVVRPMLNLLSHNNLSLGSLSLNEVKDFCENVNNLREKFDCPSCKHPVVYDQRSHILYCSFSRCGSPLRERTNS